MGESIVHLPDVPDFIEALQAETVSGESSPDPFWVSFLGMGRFPMTDSEHHFLP